MKLLNRWNFRLTAAVLAITLVAAIVIGFLYNPIWGAIATGSVASILTCITLAQSWQTTADTNRPRVIFFVHREGDFVLLNISNVGARSAFDVRVQLDRPLWFRLGDKDWTDVRYMDVREHVGFLRSSIAFLAPSQQISSLNELRAGDDQKLTETALQRFIHEGPEYNNEGITGWTIYYDQSGREFRDKTKIGFEAFQNMKLVSTVRRNVPWSDS
jgi:hypothetical protein